MTSEAISLFPFWNDAKNYRLSYLRGDLMACLSVALMALPQAMAYAFVADLPPSAGIFAAIFGTIFTASFGASKVLVSGPTNVVAILIQSGSSEILHTYYRGISGLERDAVALEIVLQLTVLIGIFQILGGLLKLGRVTQFASRSVVVGYIAGAALAIIVTQSFFFFGIGEISGASAIYSQGAFLLTHLGNTHFPSLLIGLFSLILLIWLNKQFPKIPSAAIVLTLAALLCALLQLSNAGAPGAFDVAAGHRVGKVTLLQDFGALTPGFPSFQTPFFNFRLMIQLVPFAFAITLLSVLEATSIGRQYVKAADRPYSDNQEVFGLGMSNLLSAFLGAMPSSGSFSRSALNKSAGVKTRFSAIFSGILLLIIILSLGFLVTKIPLPALAALLFFTAFTMVNMRHLFLCLKATKVDAFVVVATFLASLVFNLDVALYIGVILSVVLYLKQAAVPHLVEYTFNSAGKLRPMEEEDNRLDPSICIVHAEGELFFGAADLLQTKLHEEAEEEEVKVIILQMMNTRRIDASVCLALATLDADLKKMGKTLLASGVTPEVWLVLQNAGVMKKMGKNHFFKANDQLPSEPTRAAYAFAKSICNR